MWLFRMRYCRPSAANWMNEREQAGIVAWRFGVGRTSGETADKVDTATARLQDSAGDGRMDGRAVNRCELVLCDRRHSQRGNRLLMPSPRHLYPLHAPAAAAAPWWRWCEQPWWRDDILDRARPRQSQPQPSRSVTTACRSGFSTNLRRLQPIGSTISATPKRVWFHRAANSIFGKVKRVASEEVGLWLISSKRMPILLYSLEACALT